MTDIREMTDVRELDPAEMESVEGGNGPCVPISIVWQTHWYGDLF
jgi:hypothetical protein